MAIAETLSSETTGDDAGFIPHVTITYNHALIPAGPVMEQVAELRHLGTFRAERQHR